ncbi:hypothetical protein LAUMK41_03524 [Mycobacterium attenuatum]|nr:hypothetical protein LAUMK41_03524 [Mycobacterium attenuatum]
MPLRYVICRSACTATPQRLAAAPRRRLALPAAARRRTREFSGRAAEPNSRFARPDPNHLTGAGPLDLQPATAQPPAQKACPAANVAPQRGIHCGREASGPASIGPANVLVMHEELIETGQLTHPIQSEESGRRAGPDPRDQPREVFGRSQSGPAPFGEALKRTRQDNAGAGQQIATSAMRPESRSGIRRTTQWSRVPDSSGPPRTGRHLQLLVRQSGPACRPGKLRKRSRIHLRSHRHRSQRPGRSAI